MTESTIRKALGILQDEPDNEQAWSDLRDVLGYTGEGGSVDAGPMGARALAELLEQARDAHQMRREYDAVAELLEIETALASGDREAELVAELALVRDDVLLDDAGALAAYRRLLELRPGDASAVEAIERSEAKRSKWKDLAQRYFTESKSAGDASFKSSLLVTAAEIAYRYGLPELDAKAARDEGGRKPSRKKKKAPPKEGKDPRRDLVEKVIGLLRDALTLDPKNRRAGVLLERILRDEERWEELAKALDLIANEVPTKEERVAALLRLSRVLDRKIASKERAVSAYERVLDLSPGHPEATRALVDWFTAQEMWDHLVSLYEGQLAGGSVRAGQESGVLVQIAMVHWKMRQKPEAAEPYFERLRKLEPAHPGMLAFFREWCPKKGEQARLAQIFTDAQRAMPDGRDRAQLAAEIAGLAEEGANAQKAIEQWRNILRADPANEKAREALKRLYRQSGAFNHLADLLRSELERTPPDDAKTRLPVLREIARIYRENIKSDSALVTVLSQIIALDGADSAAVRELARVYETLGRWRDLLTTQMRLAELEADGGAKAELYRAIARRWLEQFSNVQNAVEAYEKLRESLPEDREAIDKLKELYGKRRAYRQLYDLYESEAKRLSGAEQRAVLTEMARLAADRLDRGADAARLYKKILDDDPKDLLALDALEKQAERDKDFATVAWVLERRADLCTEDNARLAVLQKLGAVYADRLQDHKGALKTWKRVLELSPGHQKALRILRDSYLAIGDYDGLTALYAEVKDWEGLVDVLSTTADRIADPAAKIDLSFRTAAILEEKLGAKDRAFRSYERVLSVKPDDERAASALVPIYESEETWGRLPALYEILFTHAKDAAEKRAILRKLADVTGNKLADRATAFRHARRAYEIAPSENGALRELEQWARAAGDWAGLADAIQTRLAGKGATADEQRVLRMKLAEVSAHHAGRADDAIGAYRELIEANPADEEAIQALDRLLRAAPDRREDLRWLFRHRAKRANDTETKIVVLGEWAMLEEEAFGSPEAAAKLYREILEEDPARAGALRALARLLLSSGDAEEAASVILRQRDLETGEGRVAREIDLARLYMGPLRKPREALAAAKRALEIAPRDPNVIAVIEALLPMAETRGAAAVVLEAAYAAAGQWAKQGEVLSVLIATAPSKADRIALHMKLADVKQKVGDVVGAFEVVARAAQDSPSELEIWDRLSVLANKTQRTQQFVEAIAQAVPERGDSGLPIDVELDLAERAATLYDEMLGDIDRAQPYLERILARDPSNDRAFVRLKQILTTREKWGELEQLYERVLAATNDPARRADRLMEVALVAEEITQDQNKAVHYYERIVEIEPGNDQAIFALDKLYQQQESWPKLGELLRRRIELAGSEDTTDLKLRLGTLLWQRLGDPKSALDYIEEVVTADSSIREARELVELCLKHPDLRQRAAIILEGVYAEREETRDLVRVLEVRLEFVEDEAERRDLLRRIAELRDERLTDDKGAFDTYARLLPLAPGDVEARTRFLDIADRLGQLGDAASVLLDAAARAEAPQPRADILSDVARIFEDAKDVDRAEHVFKEVVKIAPEDPSIALPATRALERIFTQRSKHADLAEVLRVQIALEEAVPVRRELLGRLGRLSEEILKDDARAIQAWKARLEDDPGDAEALSALDRLYHRAGDHRALVDVLRARERQSDDAGSRKGIMTRQAETLVSLGETAEAILAYRAILDDFGADRQVLGALVALYERAEQWPDLAETLESDLALANDPRDRVALLTRIGTVRHKRLGEIPAAMEAYRQALEIDPDAVTARAALEELLENEDVRREAAEILRPLYEGRRGEEAHFLRVLDIQIEAEESLDDRLLLLARAADAAENALGDPARAFAYAARGLRESAAEASVGEWLGRTERLAQRSAAWGDLVALYREIVPQMSDEQQQLELMLRIGVLARTQLSDAALAKESYNKALEIRADDTRALEALESLYEEGAEHEPLLSVLERRADIAETDDEKRRVYFKEAKILDEALADRDRAVTAYERILDLGLDPKAIAALERLYTASARWGDLVALYERELGAPNVPAGRRADLHHALGRVHEKELSEVERAFDEYAEALRLSTGHPATIQALERMMAEKTHAGRAAEMLEPVYAARLDYRQVMGTVEARLENSQDPDERRTLLRRLAKLHEEQEENYTAALDVTAKLLAEDLTDEATAGELERLARVANAPDRLAAIYAAELDKAESDEPATARLAFRTGELYEGLGDVTNALRFYQRAYKFAPEDEQSAFNAIDRLLAKAGKAQERVTLYREALDYRTDPTARLATLHTVAKIEENELKDDEAAIATYRQALDVDDSDGRSLDALARLFARRERWRDLADLYRRRAEQSALPEEEAPFRLQLAATLESRLDDVTAAIDELETVLNLMPPPADLGKAAVRSLEGLLRLADHRARVVELLRPVYEQADDWVKLVEVAKHRYAVAATPHEKVAVLRETATLLEQRGSDVNQAFACIKEAFTIDPDDGDTREELDRLAIATNRWDDLADAYEKGIAKTDGIGQRELLESLARLHDKRRDDPRRALDAWQRLYEADESDPKPLEEMGDLAMLLADWNVLVRVLAKRAELTNDDEERANLWRRIAEARRDMMDDAQGAIDAYERALELEPKNTATLDQLIVLHEEKNDAARLVDLYRRRVEESSEDESERKHELLLAAARCYEVGLSDRREAIALLGQALETKPGDADVLARLSTLYEAEKMWPDLLDNLKKQLEIASETDARISLERRMGHLLGTELDDPAGALMAYRGVLTFGYDESAARAVRLIGEGREEHRREAAEILEPVLEEAKRHDELADTLEMRLRAETDAPARAETLRRIAHLSETSLGDLARAETALLRALAETPSDAELHDDIARIARMIGKEGWERYADALAEKSASVFEAQITAGLFLRLGKVAETELRDLPRAAEAYARAAEQGGDDPEVLGALERVYAGLDDTKALVDVLERRIGIENDPAAQADLYHRLASLQIGALRDKSQGLATLRIALERVPEHEKSQASVLELLADDALFEDAWSTLEGVYRSTNRGADLGRLYAKRVDRAETTQERTRARLELARVLETEGNDAVAAQGALEEAISENPYDPEPLPELERLAEKNGRWREASDALKRALVSQDAMSLSQSAPNLSTIAAGAELWARLARMLRDKVSDAATAEEAFRRASELDPENIQLVRSIEELERGAGRERDRVATLRRLAKLEGEPDKKRELSREAASIAETVLADAKLAEEVLRGLLAENEADAWAVEELTRLREQAGDDEEVVKLLLRRAEAEGDATKAVELRHRAAEITQERIGDRDRAIALYEEIFQHDKGDRRAQDRLRALYAEPGREKDLARLLGELVDHADSPVERSTLRMEIARLHLEKFESANDAIDTFRAVLDEEPDHIEAARLLAKTLEANEKFSELADLQAQLVERARVNGDRKLEVDRMLVLGDILEHKVKDDRRALETYEAILELEPAHRVTLESVARIAESRTAWDKAATAIERLAEQTSGAEAVALYLRLANARRELGDDAGMESALERALAADPRDVTVRDQLAALYERTKKWSELAGLLVGNADLVRDGNPPWEPPPVVTGRTSLMPGPASVAPPQAAPSYVLDQTKLLRRAAEIHLKERRSAADAVPILERAAQLVPHDRELLLALVDAYTAAKREREAAQVLERVIASFGGKRTKELSLYHHRLGRALASLGDKDVALAQLDMAFKIDPGSIEVLRDLGVLALETNDLDRAQKTFRALLLQRLDATSGISKGEVFYYLGEISMKQGDKAKAVQMLERAVENEPSLARAKEMLSGLKGVS